jgi:hypothetical protein
MRQKYLSPFWLPVYAFGIVIVAGACLLRLEDSLNGVSISFIDALFTATSARPPFPPRAGQCSWFLSSWAGWAS